MKGKKCDYCSTERKTVYHYDGCPYQKEESTWLWIKDSERPIEKADRYLIRSGLERHGAKGWI